jgi:O-antigen ligase
LSIVVNGSYPRTTGLVFDLLMGYLVYYWLTVNVLDSWQKLRAALMAVVGSLLVMALHTVTAALTLPDLAEVYRFEAVWEVNEVGPSSFLGIIVVLWLSERVHGWRRVFPYALIPLFSTAMFLSGNRSGLLALVMSALFLAVIPQESGNKRSSILWVAILLAGSAVLVSDIAPRTVQRALDISIADYLDPDISSASQPFLLLAAWQMFLDHPILGAGFGSFSRLISAYVLRPWGKVAHNVFMSTLAETGILGATMLLLLYGEAFRNLWRARIVASTKQGKHAAIYALALLIGLNVVHVMFHGKHVGRTMFFVFALGAIVTRLVDNEGNEALHATSSRGWRRAFDSDSPFSI